MFQDPIENTTLRFVVISPQVPLGCDSVLDALVGYFAECFSIGICLMSLLLHDLTGIVGFRMKTTEAEGHFHPRVLLLLQIYFLEQS